MPPRETIRAGVGVAREAERTNAPGPGARRSAPGPARPVRRFDVSDRRRGKERSKAKKVALLGLIAGPWV